MKNIRRIYVVLGLGVGITLSGILGLVSSLGMVSNISGLDRVEKEGTVNTETDVKDTDEINNEYKIDKYDEDQVAKEEIDDEVEATEKVETTDKVGTTDKVEATDETNSITIVIPKNYGATEISKFLEENGIIEDWYEFLVFTRESGQATKLKDGTITMPSGATNEEILDILTKRN